jgi:hypothetical protein
MLPFEGQDSPEISAGGLKALFSTCSVGGMVAVIENIARMSSFLEYDSFLS